jgi:hypothetical protein
VFTAAAVTVTQQASGLDFMTKERLSTVLRGCTELSKLTVCLSTNGSNLEAFSAAGPLAPSLQRLEVLGRTGIVAKTMLQNLAVSSVQHTMRS